jgi:hypothetical protein
VTAAVALLGALLAWRFLPAGAAEANEAEVLELDVVDDGDTAELVEAS